MSITRNTSLRILDWQHWVRNLIAYVCNGYIICISSNKMIHYCTELGFDTGYKAFILLQDSSQPHTPGWARKEHFLIFSPFSCNFSHFSKFIFTFFFILVFRVGKQPTREGRGYANDKVWIPLLSTFRRKKKEKTSQSQLQKIKHINRYLYVIYSWTSFLQTGVEKILTVMKRPLWRSHSHPLGLTGSCIFVGFKWNYFIYLYLFSYC